MSLSIEDILRIDDQQMREVPVPEWGGSVFVRTISADARDRFEVAFADKCKTGGVRALLVAEALCDESGKLLGPTPAEIAALGHKAAGPMDRVFEAAMQLNGMRQADLEATEKNLPPTVDGDSGSG